MVTRKLCPMLALVAGCGGGGGDKQLPDAGPIKCLTATDRTVACTVTIKPELRQFETMATPTAPVQLAYNTAWDVPQHFPVECPPLATEIANASNGFAPPFTMVSCASSLPRIAMLMADDVIGQGDRFALSVNDKRIPPDSGSGRTIDPMRTYVVDRSTLERWQSAIGLSGLNWTHYGMVVLMYRDAAGNAVPGVVPTKQVAAGQDPVLRPGTDVFFLSDDRMSVVVGATATTASGAVLIPRVGGLSIDVSGTVGAGFETVGVAAPAGAVFFEHCDKP